MNIAYPVTFFYISWATTSLQDAYESDNGWGKTLILHLLDGTKASWTWLCSIYPTMSTFQETIFRSGSPFKTFSAFASILHLTYISMKVVPSTVSPSSNCILMILSWIFSPMCIIFVLHQAFNVQMKVIASGESPSLGMWGNAIILNLFKTIQHFVSLTLFSIPTNKRISRDYSTNTFWDFIDSPHNYYQQNGHPQIPYIQSLLYVSCYVLWEDFLL